VRLVEYRPEHWEALAAAAASFGKNSALAHRPFVDYYYTTRPWSRLYLLEGESGEIEGTLGIDEMRFEASGRELKLGFGNNFNALKPGAGGYLFLQWMKSTNAGIVFGGSPHTHKITRSRHWSYTPAVPTYVLNPDYATSSDDPTWRVAAKAVLRRVRRRRLGRFANRVTAAVREEIAVREERDYATALLPQQSPFPFRFAPPLDYLSWRYDTRLTFVRYRLFRILRRGTPAGYVVIQDSARRLIVSHCDGSDAETLAQGVLLALLSVGENDAEPRAVLLTSLHEAMQAIYEAFGFCRAGVRPLAIGTLKGGLDLPANTQHFLVNLDWGDNGLRSPFLDQG
jgi:hypothetical protein